MSRLKIGQSQTFWRPHVGLGHPRQRRNSFDGRSRAALPCCMGEDLALQAYYERDRERDRLASGLGRLEFERTVEIILRTLPAAPAVVADIGGGPGRYTDWLVEAGYTVVHRDVVPHHVGQVRERHGDSVDTAVGDARTLDMAEDSIDALLLLGPLYHLSERADRDQTVAEAVRVTKPGGYIYGAVIGRWAARIQAVLNDREFEERPAVLDQIDNLELSGILRPVFEGSFTGNTHTPAQLQDEFARDDLRLDSIVAIEGITSAWHDARVNEWLATDTDRAVLYDSLRALETVPDLLGASAHLLAIAQVT